MYSRYGAGAKDILLMDFPVGMDILFCAKEEKTNEILFEQWLHSGSDKSFDDYKNQFVTKRQQTNGKIENEEEILLNVKRILN